MANAAAWVASLAKPASFHHLHHVLLHDVLLHVMILIFIFKLIFHGCALLLCFRATDTCLLALEPRRSCTPGVVVAVVQVGLVPGVGQRPGGWGGHSSPGEPHGRRRVPGAHATAEVPPGWCPSRDAWGTAAVLSTPRIPLRGLHLWPESGGPGSLKLLPRPSRRARGWPSWRRARPRCADGARPGQWGAIWGAGGYS